MGKYCILDEIRWGLKGPYSTICFVRCRRGQVKSPRVLFFFFLDSMFISIDAN